MNKKMISIRMNENELNQYKELAAEHNCKLGTFIKKVLAALIHDEKFKEKLKIDGWL